MARIPAGEALLCANSMPIRQFDTWSGTRTAPLTLFCNRGVSGIDGQLSTLAGLNHAGLHDGNRPTWALLGDLSLCHDLSGLLLSARLQRPVIVINDQGGRIFDYLPQHGRPGFTELWRTPVDIDLGALAATFGLPHRRVRDAADFDRALDEALTRDPAGRLIEAVIDGDLSRDVYMKLFDAEPPPNSKLDASSGLARPPHPKRSARVRPSTDPGVRGERNGSTQRRERKKEDRHAVPGILPLFSAPLREISFLAQRRRRRTRKKDGQDMQVPESSSLFSAPLRLCASPFSPHATRSVLRRRIARLTLLGRSAQPDIPDRCRPVHLLNERSIAKLDLQAIPKMIADAGEHEAARVPSS